MNLRTKLCKQMNLWRVVVGKTGKIFFGEGLVVRGRGAGAGHVCPILNPCFYDFENDTFLNTQTICLMGELPPFICFKSVVLHHHHIIRLGETPCTLRVSAYVRTALQLVQ